VKKRMGSGKRGGERDGVAGSETVVLNSFLAWLLRLRGSPSSCSQVREYETHFLGREVGRNKSLRPFVHKKKSRRRGLMKIQRSDNSKDCVTRLIKNH